MRCTFFSGPFLLFLLRVPPHQSARWRVSSHADTIGWKLMSWSNFYPCKRHDKTQTYGGEHRGGKNRMESLTPLTVVVQEANLDVKRHAFFWYTRCVLVFLMISERSKIMKSVSNEQPKMRMFLCWWRCSLRGKRRAF